MSSNLNEVSGDSKLFMPGTGGGTGGEALGLRHS